MAGVTKLSKIEQQILCRIIDEMQEVCRTHSGYPEFYKDDERAKTLFYDFYDEYIDNQETTKERLYGYDRLVSEGKECSVSRETIKEEQQAKQDEIFEYYLRALYSHIRYTYYSFLDDNSPDEAEPDTPVSDSAGLAAHHLYEEKLSRIFGRR